MRYYNFSTYKMCISKLKFEKILIQILDKIEKNTRRKLKNFELIIVFVCIDVLFKFTNF